MWDSGKQDRKSSASLLGTKDIKDYSQLQRTLSPPPIHTHTEKVTDSHTLAIPFCPVDDSLFQHLTLICDSFRSTVSSIYFGYPANKKKTLPLEKSDLLNDQLNDGRKTYLVTWCLDLWLQFWAQLWLYVKDYPDRTEIWSFLFFTGSPRLAIRTEPNILCC